ncbi:MULTISPECIES: gp53-like domain-containing protein [unclassified Citrobacter]|uniref:gp53-like domain-containing protein n=1 Tax=unclassified Citrobacter TaxID=2644389 RepID=UPI002E11D82A|nr:MULTISPECIES: phage tail protein [unclassified Citrobacter]
MYHVDNSTGVPVMPQPSPVTSETELFFTEGGNGVPPTFPGPDWFNIIQSELINILRAAGLDPDKMDNTQILAALKKLFLSRSNPFGDIKADGAAAIATALSNLQLGEAAKQGVATNQQMQDGTATNLLPSVAAVMSLFSKRSFSMSDFIRIPDVPGGLIIQWGIMSTADANGLCSANLPIKFPVGPLVVPSPAYYNDSRNNITMTVVSTTPTQIQVFASYAHTNVPAVGAPLRYVILGR